MHHMVAHDSAYSVLTELLKQHGSGRVTEDWVRETGRSLIEHLFDQHRYSRDEAMRERSKQAIIDIGSVWRIDWKQVADHMQTWRAE